ncbi:MAG: hypothetical protein OXC31_09315 [Spirochaetaceae bacterium]|nr:hypothetical protein [Spirochaetaceae bacterium]
MSRSVLRSSPVRWTVLVDVLLAGAVTWAALSGERGVVAALVPACVCLGCWQAVVFLRARRGGLILGVERHIRLPHYFQAGVQGCHYLYLGLYYPAVREHLPLIAVQVVVFYALEMLLQWSRGRKWRAGFGPLPVVGSINLFLWFEPEYSFGQLLLIVGALASREFVRWRRDGRSSHIFNPSAIALAAAGVFLMTTNTTTATTGINHILAFELPPSFFELMFVCGILLQIFFATTLVTFGAVLALALIHYGGTLLLGAWPLFNIFHISVFLGLNLLATDPATSPRTPAGKLLFGLTWGAAIWCCYLGLRLLELPPYYDKILTVPLVNLLVPMFEKSAGIGRVSGQFGRLLERWGRANERSRRRRSSGRERAGRAITMSFRFDRAAFIAAYAGLFLLILPTLKLQYRSAEYYFKDRLPPITSPEVWKSIPLVQEKRLFCERHRRACEPWGIAEEIRNYAAFARELRLRYAVVQDIDRLRNATERDDR